MSVREGLVKIRITLSDITFHMRTFKARYVQALADVVCRCPKSSY